MVSINFRTLDDFQKAGAAGALVSGIHSGNAGDLIYSLPAVRALGIRHLLVNVYQGPDPLRKLSERTARELAPLLLAQEYLDRVSLVTAGVPLESVEPACIGVDYVLDRFRTEDTGRVHLMQAHASALHAEIDVNRPFLHVEGEAPDPGEVVLALTPRYRALDEEFLRGLMLYFDDILILALPDEWRSVAGIPGRVRRCADLLEMARLIQQARLFIGNPSLASAIAEGLKVPRIIDLTVELPVGFPIGPNGYVLPAGRPEFVDIVQRLCGDLPRVVALYSDLLRFRYGTEGERPPSADPLTLLEPDTANLTFGGGGWTRLSVADGGIFLHPGPHGGEPPLARFEKIRLSGHNCFEAEISVDHPQSAPVCFQLRLRDEDGRVIRESTREVAPGKPVRWEVTFPGALSTASLELSTALSPGAESVDYAWAWVRNPRFRAV